MKKYIILPILVISLFSTLTGCSSNTKVETETTQYTTETTKETETITEMNATSLETTSIDGKEMIETAKTVYDWFELCTPSIDANITQTFPNPVTGEPLVYNRVASEEYNTPEKLHNYLSNYFSEEIIKELMAKDIFKEGTDGYLYCVDGARGSNISIKEVSYKPQKVTDNKFVYNATVTFTDGEAAKEYSYIAEKVNNKWVFTQFPYFY